MTLRDLACNYNGSINIGVYGAETDETPEFVFPSNIHEKIKDEVMDRGVACYTVASNILNQRINVVLVKGDVSTDEAQKEVTEDADRQGSDTDELQISKES